jgi:hypothetical protein
MYVLNRECLDARYPRGVLLAVALFDIIGNQPTQVAEVRLG